MLLKYFTRVSGDVAYYQPATQSGMFNDPSGVPPIPEYAVDYDPSYQTCAFANFYDRLFYRSARMSNQIKSNFISNTQSIRHSTTKTMLGVQKQTDSPECDALKALLLSTLLVLILLFSIFLSMVLHCTIIKHHKNTVLLTFMYSR